MKKFLLLVLWFFAICPIIIAQVDNTILLSANNQDYDKSSFDLTPVRNNVISGAGRFNNSVTWPAMLFQEKFNSYLDYKRPEHLKNTSDFSMSLWYSGRPKSPQDIAVLFNKYDIKLTLNDLTGPSVNGIVDEDWKANAYNASTETFKNGYVNSLHHLVVIKENDIIYLYRDNKLIGSKDYTASPNVSTDSILIGKGLTGQIDHVTIYNGVISKEEINYLFNNNQDFTGTSTNCPDELFLSPVGATYKEENTLAFCNAPAVTIHLTSDAMGNATIDGQFTLLYPDGSSAIYSGNQISLNETGTYNIKLLTENNCVVEKTFELLPTIERPTLTFAKDHYCTGTTDFIDLTVPIGDITKNVNGISKTIEFDLYKDFQLVGTYQAKDNRIPITSGSIYRVRVNYEGCINNSLYTESLIVDEEECTVSGLDDEKKNRITIHPNPTNGIIHIDNVEDVEVSVVSSLGHTMKAKMKGNVVDLSDYKQGVYSIIVPAGNKVIVQKIVVQ